MTLHTRCVPSDRPSSDKHDFVMQIERGAVVLPARSREVGVATEMLLTKARAGVGRRGVRRRSTPQAITSARLLLWCRSARQVLSSAEHSYVAKAVVSSATPKGGKQSSAAAVRDACSTPEAEL